MLLTIDAPISAHVENVSKLKTGWQFDENYTRDLGDKWIASVSTPLLQVPSAVMPSSTNYLINPLHKDAANIKITKQQTHALDPRLR